MKSSKSISILKIQDWLCREGRGALVKVKVDNMRNYRKPRLKRKSAQRPLLKKEFAIAVVAGDGLVETKALEGV